MEVVPVHARSRVAVGARRAAARPADRRPQRAATSSTRSPARRRCGGACRASRRSTTSTTWSFPRRTSGCGRSGMRVLVPAAARRSRRIIVDAASTRPISSERLGVPGAEGRRRPARGGAAGRRAATPEAELRARLGLGDRAVDPQPRRAAPAQEPRRGHRRARRDPARAPAAARRSRLRDAVRRRAARSRARGRRRRRPAPARMAVGADLEGLYSLAELVVFPSLYEGFGLPVLEAMAAACR